MEKKVSHFKRICIVLLVAIVLYSYHNFKVGSKNIENVQLIKSSCREEIEAVSNKTDFWGNGFYIYKVSGKGIEIHLVREEKHGLHDLEDRYYKTYFEKWENKDKGKFEVIETYKDGKHGMSTEEDWLLDYRTYIEANSYEEVISATELIIEFIEYMGNPHILIKSYIKFGDEMILPHNVSPQTYDDIRKSAIQQYLKISS